MKNFLYLLIVLVPSILVAEAVSKQRYQANKDYFAGKKKVKKAAPAKIGKSKKAKKQISEDAPLMLLDESQAVIATVSPEKAQVLTSVVTLQDVNRQGFDGGQYTIEDLIDFSLMDHLSKDFKIDVTNDDINRYYQKMNLSRDHLKQIAESNWFPSVEAFNDLFKKNYRGRMALNSLVGSQLVVSEDEVEKYWIENYKDVDGLKGTIQVLVASISFFCLIILYRLLNWLVRETARTLQKNTRAISVQSGRCRLKHEMDVRNYPQVRLDRASGLQAIGDHS